MARPLDFWSHVDKLDSCWLWTGQMGTSGYGKCIDSYGSQYAHRASWIITNGPIPEGEFILHTCDVKPCVNPDHLYLGDGKDNYRDAVERGRLVVARGFQKPNTRLSDDDVATIRGLVMSGITQASVARKFEVDSSHINKIVAGTRRLATGG